MLADARKYSARRHFHYLLAIDLQAINQPAVMVVILVMTARRWSSELERFPTDLRHRDGADYGSGQEARSGAMPGHRDRRATWPWAKNRPAPKGLHQEGRWTSSRRSQGQTSPCFAPLLASSLPDAITMTQIGRKPL
ncbi:hypothetical protein [Sphingomonas carotinifaciens]|nr:hypothetical protein [Sphingomonas carotinifaciens]